MNEARSLVHQLLEELPNMFKDTNETFSAVGAAMQAAYKLASPTGGRVTVFQHTLPTIGKKLLQWFTFHSGPEYSKKSRPKKLVKSNKSI